jgi:IclR family pca regulon transcriptional regulator
MELEKYTLRTRTDRAELKLLLQRIADEGFALVDQELEVGLRSLGVPIRNRGGDVVAGLSISLLEAQLPHDRVIARYLEPLQNAAVEITNSLPA